MANLPTEDDVKKSIASWIRDYLARTRFSQVKFSKDVGITEAQVSSIVHGTYNPGFKTLIGLEFGVGAHANEVMRFPHDEVARLATTRHDQLRAKKRARRA